MACDSPIEATQEEAKETEEKITKNKKESVMSLVLKKAPEFKMDAYDAKSGHYTTVQSEDYKGKWHDGM